MITPKPGTVKLKSGEEHKIAKKKIGFSVGEERTDTNIMIREGILAFERSCSYLSDITYY